MKRKEGWELALYEATNAAFHRAHEWGAHDCASFAADCVEAMTGVDLLPERGEYHDNVSAAKVIVNSGAKSLADAVSQRLPEINVSQARRGDVMLCEGPEGDFLAINQGMTSVGPSARGLIHVPSDQAIKAFRVG